MEDTLLDAKGKTLTLLCCLAASFFFFKACCSNLADVKYVHRKLVFHVTDIYIKQGKARSVVATYQKCTQYKTLPVLGQLKINFY